MRVGLYCPVCELVRGLSHTFCPDCGDDDVLLVRIRDYGDGFVTWKTEEFKFSGKKRGGS